MAVLTGQCGGSGQAVPMLPLRGCELPQPQQLHPYTAPWVCREPGNLLFAVKLGYRSLNTDTKAQEKPPSILAKCFEILFLHKDRETLGDGNRLLFQPCQLFSATSSGKCNRMSSAYVSFPSSTIPLAAEAPGLTYFYVQRKR